MVKNEAHDNLIVRNALTDPSGATHTGGLDADLWDGQQRDAGLRKRRTWFINSDAGTEVIKLGELRSRNSRFHAHIVGAQDNGSSSARGVHVHGWKRGDVAGGEYYTIGSPNPGEEVNLIVTETTNDADGNTHNDAYVYAIAGDYTQTKVILEYEAQFTDDFVTGLGEADIVGTEVVRSDGRGDAEFSAGPTNVGQLTVQGGTYAGHDIHNEKGSTLSFRTNGNSFQFYDDTNAQSIARFAEGGNVEIPNGRLIASGRIETGSDILASSGNNPSIETAGGGSNRWNVYDAANSQHIAVFKEGGTVEIPNGDLTDGTTTIWDSTNTHVPAAQVEQGDGSGLNSDKVDGYDIYVQSTAPTTSDPYIRFEP